MQKLVPSIVGQGESAIIVPRRCNVSSFSRCAARMQVIVSSYTHYHQTWVVGLGLGQRWAASAVFACLREPEVWEKADGK